MITARRAALYDYFFIPSALDCWNNLPEHLRNNPSFSCFKRILLIGRANKHGASWKVKKMIKAGLKWSFMAQKTIKQIEQFKDALSVKLWLP